MPVNLVEFHPAAGAELRESIRWYMDRSERAAASFTEEVRIGIRFIAQGPKMCARIDDQHSLIFRERGEIIQVIEVAHCRRLPGYWRNQT